MEIDIRPQDRTQLKNFLTILGGSRRDAYIEWTMKHKGQILLPFEFIEKHAAALTKLGLLARQGRVHDFAVDL